MNTASISNMTGRAEQLIDALANAIMASTEAAAERLDLAARVAQIQQRMNAFSSVLESVNAQKDALHGRLESKGITASQRQLIEQQIDLLTIQETEILKRAGASSAQAQMAIESADGKTDRDEGDPEDHLYIRDGRRFVAVEEKPSSSNANKANNGNSSSGKKKKPSASGNGKNGGGRNQS